MNTKNKSAKTTRTDLYRCSSANEDANQPERYYYDSCNRYLGIDVQSRGLEREIIDELDTRC